MTLVLLPWLQRFCFELQKHEVIHLALPSPSAQPRPCSHIHARLGESIRERIVVIGLAVIRPTVSSEVAGEHPGFKRL